MFRNSVQLEMIPIIEPANDRVQMIGWLRLVGDLAQMVIGREVGGCLDINGDRTGGQVTWLGSQRYGGGVVVG